jgi:hypothetical protein
MMQGMIKNLVPILLTQFEKVSAADKKRFSAFLSAVCSAYLMGDRTLFDELLVRGGFPIEWKEPLVKALWGNDENQS